MLYGMYISAAGAMANSYKQDVVANNLANVDTTAFKKDLALFRARPTEAALNGSRRFSDAMLESTGGGIFALPTHTDFSQASLEKTDSPYDVALTDDGFFQVQMGDDTYYTRDGRFMTAEDGMTLVTVAGQLPVLSSEGEVITLLPGIEPVIDSNGFISQNGQNVARLGVVNFEDTNQLTKKGSNMYQADAALAQPADVTMRQNYTETSGVNALEELTEMIKAQRAFQSNVMMMQIQDQTLASAVGKLGMIS